MHKPPKVHTAFGGTQKATRLNDFMKETPAILVATPGRLNDYLDDQAVRARFNSLRTLILDEADTMLEAGARISVWFRTLNLQLVRVPARYTPNPASASI